MTGSQLIPPILWVKRKGVKTLMVVVALHGWF